VHKEKDIGLADEQPFNTISLLERATNCLVRYGPPFTPVEIVRAEGSYIFDSSGLAILDEAIAIEAIAEPHYQ
jgi:4-aminobutyrate aminotransferase-like enzyme